MKHTRLLLATLMLTGALAAQEAAPSGTALSDQQVANILKQLEELEKSVEQQRGSSLAGILKKINTGASSDAAAMSLYEECEKVLIERQDIDRGEARRREDALERQNERRTETKKEAGQEQGDFAMAVRLQLRYLALALEAHETQDVEKLIPKLNAYVAEVVAGAEKLKGRAGQFLSRPLGGGGGRGMGESPFVEALQLHRYLDSEAWSMRPLDFGDMWEKTIFPVMRAKKKSELAAQWDACINNEGAFRKASGSEQEFLLWGQTELPSKKWKRAQDLYLNGDKPLYAMKDMMDTIRSAPSHPDSTKWLKELRAIVARNAPGAATEPGVTTPPPAAQ
jgi:hypothetical protein